MWKMVLNILISLGCFLTIAPMGYSSGIQVGNCGNGAIYNSEEGLLGRKTCVSDHGDFVVRTTRQASGSESTIIMSGAAAHSYAAAQAESLRQTQAPPDPPRQIPLRDGQGYLMGGFTEVLAGSGILVTARHVLQNQAPTTLSRSFNAMGVDPANYLFYEILSSKTGLSFDVVLAIPKGKEGQLLEDFHSGTLCPCDASSLMALQYSAKFQKQVESDQSYFSYQFGTVGNKETTQSSQGKVARTSGIPVERFYLELGGQNFTTLRSSGSLVYLDSAQSAWKLGGVVECEIQAKVSRSGVAIPGGIQVIPFSILIDQGVVRQIPLQKILHEKRSQDPDCKPIDGRDGGGY